MTTTKKPRGGARPGPHPGRPVTTATVRAGNPLMAALALPGGGYSPLGKGTAEISRSGASRIVKVQLEDGSTLILTVF